jgi:hypothetical protein
MTKKALAIAAILATTACGVAVESPDGSEPLGELEAPILNGDPLASPDVHVALTIVGTGDTFCSGTLLNSRWVLTAAHCDHVVYTPDYATQMVLGSEKRGVARIVKHPSLDVMLLEASSPFPNAFPISMYPWSAAYLVGQVVTCYGYGYNAEDGTGMGTLRQGAMRVLYGGSQITLTPADERNQMSMKGDSGGGCFLNNKARALIGVDSYGTPGLRQSVYVPTSAFSQWALPIIAPSSQGLICHGRECLTNPQPLPNRFSQEVAWQPCPGQLSGPGGYAFDYEISYDMETGYDQILFNGAFLSGAGTARGTSAASHLGNRVGVYTDGKIESQGIRWLRARCPNDP